MSHLRALLFLAAIAVPVAAAAADAIVSGHGGQCITWASPQVPEVAKGRRQGALRPCAESSVAFTVAATGDVSSNGKCFVPGDPSLRAGSLVYLGDCGTPESQWTYVDGRIQSRTDPTKVLSAFWSANVIIADRAPGDPNQAYHLGAIAEGDAADTLAGAKDAAPGAAIVQRGRRGSIVRGSVVDLGASRCLIIHR